ncbi:sn-1-specific diacylglycerol lipase ABHD11 isoform X1 [Oratosquilla oratoria]|uniref:sn-1-specific diacylglycerol lipase ABHD11 isoform X1 n=1 Tax=Oratosquilla oratoria TaxID=337810 RepID=UPI003F7782E6
MKTLSLRIAKYSLSALTQQSRNACRTNITKKFSTTSRSWCAISMAYNSFQSTRPEQISDKPPIVIMHGLLGSKTNWKGLGKALNEKTGRHGLEQAFRQFENSFTISKKKKNQHQFLVNCLEEQVCPKSFGFRKHSQLGYSFLSYVYTVDARNHGDSPHADEQNYLALGDDLLHFLEEHSIPKAVLIGHSMGGRAVMVAALKQPTSVERLMVLDISPFGTSNSISTVPRFVEIMKRVSIPPELSLHEGKKYVDELLQPIVSELGIRQFLLMNLMKGDAGFYWRVNLDAIANNFNPHMSVFPLANSDLHYMSKTAFVGGALSDYIRQEDHERIRDMFPLATFQYIEGAGHWLHADKPKEFLEIASRFIDS